MLHRKTANTDDSAQLNVAATNLLDTSTVWHKSLLHGAMVTLLYLNATIKMNWEKNAEHMMNEFKKSNTANCLIVSASRGMGPTATIVYERLASLLAEKFH